MGTLLLFLVVKTVTRIIGHSVVVGGKMVVEQLHSDDPAKESLKTGGETSQANFDPQSLFLLNQRSSFPLPNFETDQIQKREFQGMTVLDWSTLQSLPKSQRPIFPQQLRVYLPAGDHPLGSLPCVLVPPAGTSLISGIPIDPESNNPEHVQYVQAGYAVITFSLDGWLNKEHPTDANLKACYQAFVKASAGLANADAAFRFAKTRLKVVDPKRILIAGHSSAGTLALLFAAHEPGLAGCIAYAPDTDVEAHLQPLISNPVVARVLPNLRQFAQQSSPKSHLKQIRCPTFVFQAAGDSVVEAASTRRFCDLLRQAGGDVQYVEVPGEDHYQTMVSPGILSGMKWMEEKLALPLQATLPVISGGIVMVEPADNPFVPVPAPPSASLTQPDAANPFMTPPVAASNSPRSADSEREPLEARRVKNADELTPGLRVLALLGRSWEGAEVVETKSFGQAKIHYLRLSHGFDRELPFASIRIPVPVDEIDHKNIQTLTFEMLRTLRQQEIDNQAVENSLLSFEGYVPGSLRIDQRQRSVAIKVIRGSEAERRAWTGIMHAKVPIIKR